MTTDLQNPVTESEEIEKEKDRKYVAQCVYHPTWHAANAVGRLAYGGDTPPDMLLSLLNELGDQVRAVRNGDLSRGDAMLSGQAHTLQSLHYYLLEKALDGYVSSTDLELFLRYSLKAQSQCRQTIETQANLKNPRSVAFMQTNIAENIQVNNAPVPPDQPKSAQSKLLGTEDGERMDSAPESNASDCNTALETVGAVNGTKVGDG